MKRTHTKLGKIVFLALILSLSCAAESITTAKSSTTTEKVETQIIPNKYIVTYGSDSLPSAVTSKISSLNGQITSNLVGTGILIITSDDPNFATEIAKVADVTSVVNDRRKRWIDPEWTESVITSSDINPPFSDNPNRLFNLQWGLDAINAPEAWKAGARGSGVLVAVLDTGFDLEHIDLKENIILQKSKSFVPEEGLAWEGPEGELSHGTHVAGIIAGVDNNYGIVGVAPEAKLMLVKVLSDEDGSGDDSWILQGMQHAIDHGADIISMSLGGYDHISSPWVTAYSYMATYAKRKGTTVIASAGNGNRDLDERRRLFGEIHIPSDAANVISVSATAPIGWAKAFRTANFDNIASYSNFGSTIDFAAPGGNRRWAGPANEVATIAGITRTVSTFDLVLSSVNGGWTWLSGTSMAAPHVSGVAALVIGKTGKIKPDQLKEILIYSADDLGAPYHDVYYGYGRVNAYKAVMACGSRY